MIPTSYEIGNFKAIRAPQTLKLRPVTLIFGKNSAGKSSVIQSLLLCKHAVEKKNFDFTSETQWGQIIDLGGFRQYVHRHEVDSDLTFRFTFSRSLRERTASGLDSQIDRVVQAAAGGKNESAWSFCFFNHISELSVSFTVGLVDEVEKNADPDVPVVKTASVSADGSSLINFARDASGTLSLSKWDTIEKPMIIALASLAAALIDYLNAQQEQTQSTLQDVVEWSGLLAEAAPAAIIARVEETYHFLRDQMTEAQQTLPPALRERQERLIELLAQSELFARFASSVRNRLDDILKSPSASGRSAGAEPIRDLWLEGSGLAFAQPKRSRLPTERTPLHPETGMVEPLEAIDDPISFFASEPGVEDNLTVAAKSMRFDLELIVQAVLESLQYWLLGAEYFGPFRSIPGRLFQLVGSARAGTDDQGYLALKRVAADPALLREVSNLLQETLDSPYRLEVRKLAPQVDQARLEESIQRAAELHTKSGVPKLKNEIDEIFRAQLSGRTTRGLYLVDIRNGTELDFCDVGFGIGQVLPLLMDIATTRRGIVSIEQPEVHIHPKMQADLADVFIEQVRQSSTLQKIFVLETHSEHLILRLLRRIRETTGAADADTVRSESKPGPLIYPDHLGVHWVEMVDGAAIVTPIEVTTDGDFERGWPEGFFDERFKEMP